MQYHIDEKYYIQFSIKNHSVETKYIRLPVIKAWQLEYFCFYFKTMELTRLTLVKFSIFDTLWVFNETCNDMNYL